MRFILATVTAWTIASSAFAQTPQRTFTYVDLQGWGNRNLADGQGSGNPDNNLTSLPSGPQPFGDVKFKIDEKLIQLGSTILDDLPEKVEGITVNRRVSKLHFLHSTCFGAGATEDEMGISYVKDGTLIGEYRVNYEDRSAMIIPIIYGEDVRDWFFREGWKSTSRGKMVWKGSNEVSKSYSKEIRIFLSNWENSYPDKVVTTIDFSSKKTETPAAPFCLAISSEGDRAR